MNRYLTQSGWKTIVQQSKGKVKDNGLQRALADYEKLPADKYADRMKALSRVFKLGLDLNNTKVRIGIPSVEDYLSKMLEASVKEQEEIEKEKKAAGTSATDKRVAENMVIDAATTTALSAKTNASFFGRQVVAACTAFQVYSKSKLDELEDEITAGDILGPLAAIVTGGISEVLVARVADPIGARLVKEMAKLAEGAFLKRVESVGKDSDDLEKAISSLILGATDAATAVEGVVTRIIIPQCDKVIDGVNSGKRLSDELTAFIEPFIRQKTSSMDTLLEQRFGLPTPAKSKQTQIKIYQEMVKRFEKMAIIAATPSGEKMQWNITGIPMNVNRKAEERAKQAGKAREKDISSKEKEMGL